MPPHRIKLLQTHNPADGLSNAAIGRKLPCNAAARFFLQCDLLLAPTLATPPIAPHMQGPETIKGRVVDFFDWLGFCLPHNMAGPAASVPAELTSDGLPIGMQIVGRLLSVATMLRAAAVHEATQLRAHLRPAHLTQIKA